MQARVIFPFRVNSGKQPLHSRRRACRFRNTAAPVQNDRLGHAAGCRASRAPEAPTQGGRPPFRFYEVSDNLPVLVHDQIADRAEVPGLLRPAPYLVAVERVGDLLRGHPNR